MSSLQINFQCCNHIFFILIRFIKDTVLNCKFEDIQINIVACMVGTVATSGTLESTTVFKMSCVTHLSFSVLTYSYWYVF